ncbi:UNVERIFIED_CONTAM: hypothetical protein K2H54_037685 [Gekko kuhli]
MAYASVDAEICPGLEEGASELAGSAKQVNQTTEHTPETFEKHLKALREAPGSESYSTPREQKAQLFMDVFKFKAQKRQQLPSPLIEIHEEFHNSLPLQ